ncbi:unnamed protein product [Prunus brigantina]
MMCHAMANLCDNKMTQDTDLEKQIASLQQYLINNAMYKRFKYL